MALCIPQGTFREMRSDSTRLVALDADHPGFRDPAYRARRDLIARAATEHRRGDPAPVIAYTDAEHALWRDVSRALEPLHAARACREIREAQNRLRLSRERIPQLADVSSRIESVTGFRLEPVAGLVEARIFLEALGESVFLCTQYIRHTSRPHYTPEPDVIHELCGHAATLSDPQFAELSRAFGRAAQKAADERLLELERLYWFTLEYGCIREDGAIKAVGAGLLSSTGELSHFDRQADLRPFHAETAARTDYDPTDYQPVLYPAASFAELVRESQSFLQSQRSA